MDTLQILCTMRNVNSYLDVYASDLLPRSITKTCINTVNSDPHTEGCLHWLAVYFRTISLRAFHFDSCGIVSFLLDILAFIRRNRTTWDLKKRQLPGLTSDVCGKYCCLLALYMDRGYTTQQFVALFDACNADRQVEGMFTA